MPGNPHPAETAFESHDDQQMVALWKEHGRHVVADADEVRNDDLSGQFGGIYVRSTAANYKLDTEELGDDDGVNIIRDAAGNAFVRTVDAQSESQRVHTAAGAVTVTADDVDIIIVDKTVGATTTVNLPSAADRAKPVRIVDGKSDAATNNISLVPASGEETYGIVDNVVVIDGNGGSVKLTPRADGSGWF